MTGEKFSEVDIDLLADYVGGALGGTPEESAVAGLIADDPTWREAYLDLTAGVGAVTASLRSWGAEPEPMPADLIARLDAALLAPDANATSHGLSPVDADTGRGALGTGPGATAGGATAAADPAGAPVRHLVGVPKRSARGKTARRLKWAAPVGIAAAVLAFAGFGLQQMGSSDSSDSEVSTAAGAGSGGQPMLDASPQILDSGANYTELSLGQLAAKRTTDLSGAEQAPAQSKSLPTAGVMIADPLAPLRVREALLACLDAIAAENGAGTITAQSVDFARFQGSPAAVVLFTAANGSWVWAVGGDCGSPGSRSARLGSLRVG